MAAAGPLSGVRILDLSQVVSGPMATMVLCDQGAEVIKVEGLSNLDSAHFMGQQGSAKAPGLSGLHMAVNRGKRSLVVDLKRAEGRDLVLRLCKTCDVFVQNFRPGAIERLGLGYDAVKAANPAVVYVAVSGFGPSGPYSKKPIYDPVIQGAAGFFATQQDWDAAEDGASFVPRPMQQLVCDKVAALTLSQAVTAALLRRARGHAGAQRVELSMLDAAMQFAWPDVWGWHDSFTTATTPNPGPFAKYISKMQVKTADGHISWCLVSDAQFRGMCEALGRGHVARDPRFKDIAARVANQEAYKELIDGFVAEMGTRRSADLLAAFDRHGVPSGPVNSLPGVLADPQVRHNRVVVEATHPLTGGVRQCRPAAVFDGAVPGARPPAPALGQDTAAVLRAAGVADAEIRRLAGAGVVLAPGHAAPPAPKL